jgi:predicted nucleic acid-binding protein
VNLFFDTSSFFKLYQQENETQQILDQLIKIGSYQIYLSEITLVEIYSAFLKKVRTKEISLRQASDVIDLMETDLNQIKLVKINESLIRSSQILLLKFGLSGLRSLDAIQLASVIQIKNRIDVAFTHDLLLKRFFIEEGINCEVM